MKDWFKPNSVGDYVGALFLMVVFFIGIVIFWQTSVIPSKVIPPQKPAVVSCNRTDSEYRDLVAKGQSVRLTSEQWSYALNGHFVGEKTVVTRRSGEVACGYIYIVAHKGSSPLSEKYDSIFVSPQGLGGHLVRTRSIEIAENDPKRTQVLLPLSAIPYLYSLPYNPDAQDFAVANWVNLLNASDRIEFLIGLSVENPSAIIDEVRIAYKCRGLDGEETFDCQLGVEK